jgi:hypothetical protein
MNHYLCTTDRLAPESPEVLADLNSWWRAPHAIHPEPPPHRRRGVAEVERALRSSRPRIQVVRGLRQVGKTTALQQIVASRIRAGQPPTDVLLIRFDLLPLPVAARGSRIARSSGLSVSVSALQVPHTSA